MNLSHLDIRTFQRWCIVVTIVLVDSILWVNTMESGIAKQPLFVLGAALVASLFLMEWIRNRTAEISFSTINILVILHLPLFLFSAFRMYDPVYTWRALAFGVSCIIFFFAGSSLFQTKRETDLLFKSFEWLTVLLCIVAAFQFFAGEKLPFNFYIKPYGRVSSLLGHSVFFSAYLVVVFPIILGQTFYRQFHGKSVLLRYVLLMVIILALLATQTRSSILGWIVSMGVFVLLAPRGNRMKQAVLIIGIILASAFAYSTIIRPELGQQFFTKLDEGRGSTLARRISFWTTGKDAFAAAPIFGHGIGSYERSVLEYRSPEYWKVQSEDIVPHAHHEVIEIAVEYGSVGLLIFIATFAIVLQQGITIVRKTHGWECWIVAGITSSLVAIGVDNLANVSLRQAPIAALVWLLMGLLWSPVLALESKKNLSVQILLPKITAPVPVLVWILFAFLYVKNQAKEIESSIHLNRSLQYDDRYSQEAIAECEAGVAEDPENLIARSYLIEKYANAEKWGEALRSASELQRFSPSYPKSSLVKAFALFHLGRYPEALESIGKELQKRSHPEAFLIQAVIYHGLHDEQGERIALINLLKKIIEAKSTFAYRAECIRLIELCRMDSEKKQMAALIDSLENIDPEGRDFLEAEKMKLQTDVIP
jgi:O-antigen ligase